MGAEGWVLRYELTPEEVAAAMVDHLPAVRQGVRQIRKLSLLASIVLALVLVLGGGSVVAAVVTPVVLTAAIWGLTTRRLRITTYLKQVAATPSYTEPTELVIEGDGLRLRSPLHTAWYSWRYWQSVIDAPDGVALILRGGWGVQLVPARAFAPGQQPVWAEAARRGVEPHPTAAA